MIISGATADIRVLWVRNLELAQGCFIFVRPEVQFKIQLFPLFSLHASRTRLTDTISYRLTPHHIAWRDYVQHPRRARYPCLENGQTACRM